MAQLKSDLFSHPRGSFALQHGTGHCRMNQKCKPENSQPALLKVRGQANSPFLSLSLSAERLESQFLPFLAQGAQESRKTSLSLSPRLENGDNPVSLSVSSLGAGLVATPPLGCRRREGSCSSSGGSRHPLLDSYSFSRSDPPQTGQAPPSPVLLPEGRVNPQKAMSAGLARPRS